MKTHKWTQELETKRMILRPFKPEDTAFVLNHFGNEDVTRYLYDEEPLENLEQADALIKFFDDSESKSFTRWVLELKESKEPIGTCGFHLLDVTNESVEIGYDLKKDYWHQGYMIEALNVILDEAFSKGINRIQAFIALDNIGSYTLLEKLNFKREGLIRDKHLFRGKYYDHYCYALLKREFKDSMK